MTLKSRVKHLINKDRAAESQIWNRIFLTSRDPNAWDAAELAMMVDTRNYESNNRWQQAHAIQQLSADTISRTEELLQRLASCLRRGDWSGHPREEVGLPEQDSS